MRQSREGQCEVEGCDSKILAKRMCGKHYQRKVAELKKVNPCECGCGELTSARFVAGHHTRLFSKEEQTRRGRMNNGDKQRAAFEGTSEYYRKIRGVHEHRRVMEEKIGRKLCPDEIVHHIDGNKRNNSPENLQLVTRSEHMKIHLPELHRARKKKHAQLPRKRR